MNAGHLVVDCAMMWPLLREPSSALKTGAIMALARALSVHMQGEAQWFHRQHSILQLSRYLDSQYPVIRWPRWEDVARPRFGTSHLSFESVVPVLGPAKQ